MRQRQRIRRDAAQQGGGQHDGEERVARAGSIKRLGGHGGTKLTLALLDQPGACGALGKVIARRQYCQQKLQVELIGRSQWTVRYRQRLQQLAETDIAVWLYGEPGTGRMTGARYLHQLGRHAEGPFIACELTPANAHTLNELIAQAQGGTLVLSHPEHLTHEQQHQLVQLQSHEKRPFRLIGIGSASLVELAASSQIVAELYYCFAMTQIGCQPLSKRPDDIEPLFHHYLQKTCQRLNHPVPEVDAGLLKGMMRRVWPNNVRELANAAELFAVGVLPLAETVNPLMHIGEPTPLDQRVEDVERQIITEALNIHHRCGACQNPIAGRSRRSVYRKSV